MSGTTTSLPEKWRVTTIGSVCSKPQYGWTTSAADSGELKLLRTTDITHGPVDWSTVPYCRDVPPDVDKYLLAEGDIVVSRAGSVGVSCRVVAPERSVFASYLIRFRPKEGVDGKYLTYVLQSPAYWAQVRGSTAGIAIPNVNASKLEAFHFPLAPLPEQRRIVSEIEKQFTRLEAGVAALRRVQANLKRYRAAVLKAACEGNLVPTEAELAKTGNWKAKFETGETLLARILDERRKNWQGRGKYKEPVAPDTTKLPHLAEGWIWTTIGACFPVVIGATPSRTKASYWGGGIPWVSSGEVRFTAIVGTRETITKEGLENSSTRLNPKGSVLLGMIGEGKTRGQTAILKIDACNNQNSAAIWVSRTVIPPEYVYYWLWSQYDNTRRTSSGNNQPALNKARVEAILLPLPPLAEQTRIVAEVERRLSAVEELEAVVSANLQRATRLRQSILQKAFAANL